MRTILIITIMLLSFCLPVYSFVYAGSGHGLSADNSSIATVVNKVDNTFNITGGTVKTNNLFHSFSNFNLETEEIADFQGNAGIANIISRVTGANDSWINGRIKSSIAGANLYLLNPNGIMFGSGASLDITGSFHVSTADYLKFGDGNILYADLGSESVLTSVPVEAFGFLGDDVGTISLNGTKLKGNEGNTISFIGGDINVHSGHTLSFNGNDYVTTNKSLLNDVLGGFTVQGWIYPESSGNRIGFFGQNDSVEFGFSDSSTIMCWTPQGYVSHNFLDSDLNKWIHVATTWNGNELSLYVDGEQVATAPKLSHSSLQYKFNIGGGGIWDESGNNFHGIINDVRVYDRHLDASEIKALSQKTDQLSLKNGLIGHWRLDGVEKNTLKDLSSNSNDGCIHSDDFQNSFIAAPGGRINMASIDSVGEVIITATGIEVSNNQLRDININTDSVISISNNENSSTAGSIFIKAKDFNFGGNSHLYGHNHSPFNVIDSININANNISINNAYISGNNYSTGTGGKLSLYAADSVNVNNSSINVSAQGAGNAGELEISAKNISFTDGARIDSTTYGQGKGGTITLSAEETLHFDGYSVDGYGYNRDVDDRTRIKMDSAATATGDAGSLEIKANNIKFTNGAHIATDTYGKGNGGNIKLNADEMLHLDGGGDKYGSIQAKSGWESWKNWNDNNTKTFGDAGSLEINAKDMKFTNDALINFSTYNSGDAGKIKFTAEDTVYFDDNSRILMTSGNKDATNVEYFKILGNAGELVIDAKNIKFTNKSFIWSSIFGKGSGGTVRLKASESINFDNDSCIDGKSEFHATGNAGSMEVEAKNISFTNGARIDSTTHGQGKGGTITLSAEETLRFHGYSVDGYGYNRGVDDRTRIKMDSTATATGDAGSLEINANNIIFTDGAHIATDTYGKGNGGNIKLNADEMLHLDGGGDKYGSIQAKSGWESWKNWNDNNTKTFGDAGSLEINAKDMKFTNDALINFSTYNSGDAGNIKFTAGDTVYFDDNSRIIITSGYENATNVEYFKILGNIGELVIDAKNIKFTNKSFIWSSIFGKGSGGTVRLKASESINFDNGSGIESKSASKETQAAGDAGTVEIAVKNIELTSGSYINSSSEGTGNPGDINIQANNLKLNDKAYIDSESKDGDDYSIIRLNIAETIFIDNEAYINASSAGPAYAGDIIIEAQNLTMNKEAYISAESKSKDAGAGGYGRVYVDVSEEINMDDESKISVTTHGPGRAGDIYFSSGDYNDQDYNFEFDNSNGVRLFTLSGGASIESISDGSGNAGNLELYALNLELNQAYISSQSLSEHNDAGQAGDIKITTKDSVILKSASNITTESKKAGGGNIEIETVNKLYLYKSEISTSTNSQSFEDRGGDIFIDPMFVILNDSTIKANANEGSGGDITIVADYFMPSPDSIIEASSKKSTPGEIKIQAVEIDIAGALSSMDTKLLDATKWQKTPCSLRSAENISRLIVEGRDATPAPVDDFLSGLNSILSDEYFFRPDNNPERYKAINPKLFEELFADKMADKDICNTNEKCTDRGRCK